jgi:DNA-binding transcriptional ArsR family regulator
MRRDVFQAIADPTRRDIMGLLAKQPMTPKDVTESFKVSRQAISKHIKFLAECGLLGVSIRGREHYYNIEPERLAEIVEWIEPFRKMYENRFDRLDKVLHHLKSE